VKLLMGIELQVEANNAPDLPWWLCETLQKHNLVLTRRPNFLGEKFGSFDATS
jgi:hypothetical protein